MDIEERAERWAARYMLDNGIELSDAHFPQALIDAYLAGSEQTQKDYVEHFYSGENGWTAK